MTTVNQLLKNERIRRKKKSKTPRLEKSPQKKGLCERVFLITPKKPNSALRKITRVILLSTKTKTHAYIPGIGHKLQRFSNVLIRGGRVKDVPGLRYQVIRGVLDSTPVYSRRRALSKYGCTNFFMVRKKKRWKK